MSLKEIYAPTAGAKNDVLTILNRLKSVRFNAFPMGNNGLHFSKISGINEDQAADLAALKKKHIGNLGLNIK